MPNRFTDREKCLMDLLRSDGIYPFEFTDKDTMKNIGVPYFQSLVGPTPVIDYDSLQNDDVKALISHVAEDDWNALCDKMTPDEQVVMTAVTDSQYIQPGQNDIHGWRNAIENYKDYIIDTHPADNRVQAMKQRTQSGAMNHLNVSDEFLRESVIATYGPDDIRTILDGGSLSIRFTNAGELVPAGSSPSTGFLGEKAKSPTIEEDFLEFEQMDEDGNMEWVTMDREAFNKYIRENLMSYNDSLVRSVCDETGCGDDIMALFDCGICGAEDGYRALLAWQQIYPNLPAGMIIGGKTSVRADQNLTLQEFDDYLGVSTDLIDKGQVLFHGDDLAEWIKNVNTLLKDDLTSGRDSLSDTVEICQAFADGTDYHDIEKIVQARSGDDANPKTVECLVRRYSPEGNGFYDSMKDAKKTEHRSGLDIFDDSESNEKKEDEEEKE